MTLNAAESSPDHESINSSLSTDSLKKEDHTNEVIDEVMETNVNEVETIADKVELTGEEQLSIRETINNVLEKTEEKISPSSKKKGMLNRPMSEMS